MAALESDFEYTYTRNVEDSIEKLKASNFDLVISDIQLIGGTSFGVFDLVKTSTPIIFCTAYDAHLLKAFQANGIAYVLKPYSQMDITAAVQKHQDLFQKEFDQQGFFQQFNSILKQNDVFKKRFVIKKPEGIKLVNTTDVCYIEACGDFCKLKDSDGKLHKDSSSIGSLANEFDPEHFFRINRSYIVNILFIEEIIPYHKNRLLLKIKGLKDAVITSTTTTKECRKWIDR